MKIYKNFGFCSIPRNLLFVGKAKKKGGFNALHIRLSLQKFMQSFFSLWFYSHEIPSPWLNTEGYKNSPLVIILGKREMQFISQV